MAGRAGSAAGRRRSATAAHEVSGVEDDRGQAGILGPALEAEALHHGEFGGAIHHRQPFAGTVDPHFAAGIGGTHGKQSVAQPVAARRGVPGAHVIGIQIHAVRVGRRDPPDIRVRLGGVLRIGGVVLRNRLLRPALRIAADVLHDGVEGNGRRIGADGDIADVLLADHGVRRAGEANGAGGVLAQDFEVERPAIEHRALGSRPVAFVVVAFRHGPDFVAAVIEPEVLRGRSIGPERLALELGIDEQEIVAGERHLHQPSAELRNDFQLHPRIGHLHRLPAVILGIGDVAAARRLALPGDRAGKQHEKGKVAHGGNDNSYRLTAFSYQRSACVLLFCGQTAAVS